MQLEQAGNYILTKLSEDLPAHLHYHNVHHTNDVYKACIQLAGLSGINGDEKKLLLTAALYHDCGFLKTYDEHELVSCQIARVSLQKYSYTIAEIEQICEMMMATRVPQLPMGLLGQILADADLDYLGRDDFFVVSDKLFSELYTLGKVKSIAEWDRIQIDFLENHRYFTDAAMHLRRPKKEEHLKQLKVKLIKEI